MECWHSYSQGLAELPGSASVSVEASVWCMGFRNEGDLSWGAGDDLPTDGHLAFTILPNSNST